MNAQRNRNDEPAFPRSYSHDGHNGMSLRDYLASQVVGQPDSHRPTSAYQWVRWCFGLSYKGCRSYYSHLAKSAYDMADAMLAERDNPTTTK